MSPIERRNRAILRRLAAAVLLRAVADAEAGDRSARRWLLDDGLELAEALGIDEDRVRAWCDSAEAERQRAGIFKCPPRLPRPIPARPARSSPARSGKSHPQEETNHERVV